MLSKSVAHALSYDARLVASPLLGAVAEPVCSKIEEVMSGAILGKHLCEDSLAQARLCGSCGGIGLRREAEGLMADAAL